MSKHRVIPQIKTYMSTNPHTIGVEQTMARAHEIMRENHLRHLPVLKASRLVGILSDRDLHMVETLRDVDPQTVCVEEAMTQDVYAVAPDAPLDEVVKDMATRKYGSVVVVDHAHVVGIFTTVDACRAFADMLTHG
jgi:acetoin utilization protein AcuB